MGGTITVHSEIGKGSEFVVQLPCRISGTSAKFEPLPELNGLHALVADDDTDTCLSICSMLRKIGMRPDWTNYGKEAVIRAKEALDQADEFRVYIIDWLMPDLNGIETVRRIRKVIGDDTMKEGETRILTATISQVNANNSIGAHLSSPVFHFPHGGILGFSQCALVCATASAKHIGQRCFEILLQQHFYCAGRHNP